MPIDPSFAVSGRRVADRRPRRRPAAADGARRRRASARRCSPSSIQSLRPTQTEAAERVAGARHRQGHRPTAVVMAVERAQLSMQLAARSARRPSRPSRTSSTPRSRPEPCRLPPNLLALPAKPKALLGVSAVGDPRGRVLPAPDRHGAAATRRSPRASTRRRPARSPPRSTSRASPTSCRTTAPRSPSRRPTRAGAHRARRAGRRRRRGGGDAARLRALRQAEARRHRLPAEGHLPARARGRDRQHDQRRPGRLGPGPARAARGRPLRRRATPATAAVLLGNAADALEPGAVRGIAQLVVLLGQGPQDRERHDHRRHRPAPVAQRRGRRRGRAATTKQAAEQRYARQLEAPQRDARPTLGPTRRRSRSTPT